MEEEEVEEKHIVEEEAGVMQTIEMSNAVTANSLGTMSLSEGKRNLT